MDPELEDRLKAAAEMIRTERRIYNNKLRQVVEGRAEYNSEDLMRLVGTLEAAYNHALASIAADGDIYCLLKHISYAIILMGELDEPNVEPLYDILAIISNGKIEACSSCQREEDNNNNKEEA